MMGSMEDALQQLYYGHSCTNGCTHEIVQLVDDNIIDDILNDFARALHNGELNGKRIHSGLYSETARKLTEAITKGVGKVSRQGLGGTGLGAGLDVGLRSGLGFGALAVSGWISGLSRFIACSVLVFSAAR